MLTLTHEWEDPDPMPAGENTLTKDQRDALVTDNLGLARKIAKQTARMDSNCDAENLYAEAGLLMVESARRWHPDGTPGNPKGVPFGAFAASYLRKRLVGLVVDATPRDGRAVVRGLDMGAVAGRGDDGEPDAISRPDDFDRELLASLKPDARAVVEAIVFERITAAEAAVRFDRPEKDISLILRNSIPLLQRRRASLDADDLFDGEGEADETAEAGAA